MKENILEYKGYHAKIEFDANDFIIHGKIEGIKDLVFFESDSAKEIEAEFHSAVDDYLEMCEAIGQEPDKEYSGSFNIRITPELHKQLAMKASRDEISLNAEVERALQAYLKNGDEAQHIHIGKIEVKVEGPYNPVSAGEKGKIIPISNHFNNSWGDIQEERRTS